MITAIDSQAPISGAAPKYSISYIIVPVSIPSWIVPKSSGIKIVSERANERIIIKYKILFMRKI